MEEYSNKAFVVPFYTKEDIQEGRCEVFPFSCDYMQYDKQKHEYMLTENALVKYGIDVSDMQPVEKQEFLRVVTRAVYSFIKEKAGLKNYYKMMYRIAKGLGAPQLSRLAFRTIFLEDVLIVTAREIANKGYSKDMPKTIVSPDSGRIKANDLSKNDGYWLHDDVITALDSLNLLNSQPIVSSYQINWEDF